MTTATLANPVEAIKRGAPHVIHSDAELSVYTKALFHLTSKAKTTRSEDEAIELLTLLVEKYETEHYPVPAADPVTVLRSLLNSHGLRQKDLADIFGGEGNVSQVFAGRRDLNKDHIAKLAAWFNVSPAVFFG
ncbi:helix-turn-helix domain-containing protein [Edaphobacter aggregans]|uniref:helix-turn-helix domain-containing protein n=1 Tax=Edaphobacter aggregans TaxID=570835 RepID=UPI0006922A57|nr:helix-turn-helix domain-containing protein [Edaphobacter aggregans]